MTVPMYHIPTARAVGPTISVQPATAAADVGAEFNVDVMVSEVAGLFGYDFSLLYDTSVLTVTRATLAGTVFDGLPNFPVKQDVFEGLGQVRFAVTLLGVDGVDVVGSASMLKLTMRVDRLAVSSLHIVDDILVILVGGRPMPLDHATMDGLFIPPPSIGLRNVGCRAEIPGFNINAHGTTQTLFCRVENNGLAAGTIRIDFSYFSIGGASGLVSSREMTLQPGELATLTAQVTVAVAFDVFIVQGTIIRIVPLPDSSIVYIPGESDVFKFNVRVCTSGECL